MNISEFLARQNIPFERLDHTPAYSAQQMAGALHVPGGQVAKTVLVRAPSDGQHYVVAIIPAPEELDFAKVAAVTLVTKAELASSVEMSCRFPDCELGVVPPFGSEYGMQTIVDQRSAAIESITFEGSTHKESIRMRFDDYQRIENPLVADICQ